MDRVLVELGYWLLVGMHLQYHSLCLEVSINGTGLDGRIYVVSLSTSLVLELPRTGSADI